MSVKDGSESRQSQRAFCCEPYMSQSGVIALDIDSSPSEVGSRLTSLEKQSSLKGIIVKACGTENRKGGKWVFFGNIEFIDSLRHS